MPTTTHRVDDETTITVWPTTDPISGRAGYVARHAINGWELPTSQGEGNTAEAAHADCLERLTDARKLEARAAALTDAGIYADLTGHAPGIHQQMQDATGAPPARPGQCHYCGLEPRACDCH